MRQFIRDWKSVDAPASFNNVEDISNRLKKARRIERFAGRLATLGLAGAMVDGAVSAIVTISGVVNSATGGPAFESMPVEVAGGTSLAALAIIGIGGYLKNRSASGTAVQLERVLAERASSIAPPGLHEADELESAQVRSLRPTQTP
jgi:hypothetical protein